MKKSIFSAALVAAMAAVLMTSCNKSQQEEASAEPAAKAGEMKIAYVEIDSIDAQYQFCKDQKALILKDSASISKTLQQKQAELQSAANNFQQKYQQNAYTQQQAQQINAGLQRQAQELEGLRQRLVGGLDEKVMGYHKELQDRVENFLKEYNNDKKYSVIFTKQGINQILYADKSLDITKEIVAGLNKAYKPSASNAAAATSAKKDKK